MDYTCACFIIMFYYYIMLKCLLVNKLLPLFTFLGLALSSVPVILAKYNHISGFIPEPRTHTRLYWVGMTEASFLNRVLVSTCVSESVLGCFTLETAIYADVSQP